MNERIQELAEQAAKQVSDDLRKEDEAKWYSDLPMDQSKFQEKFAELIVEEMYDFMCKATDNDGAWPSSSEVKQHFGVDGMSTEDKKTLIKELLGVKNETC